MGRGGEERGGERDGEGRREDGRGGEWRGGEGRGEGRGEEGRDCICGFAHTHPPPQGLNFGITKLLLDLVVLYCNMMLLLSTIDDRRALVALYNHAYDLNRGSGWVLGPASDWLNWVM